MTPCCLLRFLVLCYFPLLLLAHPSIKYYGKCPLHYSCKKFGDIYFPFTNTNSSECGLLIRGCNDPFAYEHEHEHAEVQLGNKWYEILPNFYVPYSIIVPDMELEEHLSSKDCTVFDFNYTFPPLPNYTIVPFQITNIITLYKCNHNVSLEGPDHITYKCPHSDYDMHYFNHREHDNDSSDSFGSCSRIQLPVDLKSFPNTDPFKFLTSKFHIQVNLSLRCEHCYERADKCFDNGVFYCDKAKKTWIHTVIVGSVIAGAAGIIITALIIYIRRRTSWAFKYQSRNISGHPHSNGDLESSGIFFGIPVFSYKELEEATNNFDRARELGDGGFGIVYYGRLRDGREVAVKRLYEHNYKRVQQFMTEIEILTRLRHKNLVTLYGCTSRHSRELILVYEYIPNGTVACHLSGDLGKPASLPWPVRMRIAVETASALAYLHAHDTIHRDVKTDNILLDNHFSVKVADFGLSRLFPDDATHVSTAPQGTPGYLDPEYHRCYQLTTKSDVYSFGVVLIELISSMLAVDVTRIRDEINLANLALKKIQNSVLSELVDPSLGFESDDEVRRMIVSVAELALQCLQMDKELRPSMDQVLSELERIENGPDELEHLEEEDHHEIQISNTKVHLPPSLSPENDEVGSLKNLKTPRLHQTH